MLQMDESACAAELHSSSRPEQRLQCTLGNLRAPQEENGILINPSIHGERELNKNWPRLETPSCHGLFLGRGTVFVSAS